MHERCPLTNPSAIISAPNTTHRRRRLWFALCLLPLLPVLAPALRADYTARLDPTAPAQTFDGWGTSLCWFGNAVGRWSEPQRRAIADLLFSPGGLGLTVVRYNIGGGENPDHHHMPAFRQMEGFEPSPGKWDWNADAGQRWMLLAAVARGANRLEAFSNSPPYWMTISRCASGNADPGADNLDPRFRIAYADYLAEVVLHFRVAWGIAFQTLEAFNEPYTDYWKAFGKQEGCHFERSAQSTVIKLVRAALDRRQLKAVLIAASDETNFDRAIGTFESYDRKARADVAQINAHAYATQRRSELRKLARSFGKVLVMSEVDGPGGVGHDHDAMAPALELADRIIGDMRDLQPVRWIFWQAVEDEAIQKSANKNWGLIHADLQGHTEAYVLTKKYFAMANFTKYIRPGQVFLPIDDANSIAALDFGSGVLAIVTKNPSGQDVRVTYDLSSFADVAGPAVPHRTSATENLVLLPAVAVSKKTFIATLQPGSITTFVITGVACAR